MIWVYLVDEVLFTNVLFLARVPLLGARVVRFTKKLRCSSEVAIHVELVVTVVLPDGKQEGH